MTAASNFVWSRTAAIVFLTVGAILATDHREPTGTQSNLPPATPPRRYAGAAHHEPPRCAHRRARRRRPAHRARLRPPGARRREDGAARLAGVPRPRRV